MNPNKDSSDGENRSGNLVIMIVVLIVILAIVFILIYKFKPEANDFNSIEREVKNTPKEQTEAIDASIQRINNLTNEIRLFDELYDELIYTESPEIDRIHEFVSQYKNYARQYAENMNEFEATAVSSKDYDSTTMRSDRQQKLLESSINDLIKSIENKKKIFRSIPAAYPIAKKDARIVSGFGMRDHPILNEPRMHTGIDIQAPVGTIVVAPANGKVKMIEEHISAGYGRPCLIEHKFGYQTFYGHLVRLEVYDNKLVQKGDIIGRVGDTGLSSGPHLHYEVRKNGKPLNPSYFIFEGLTRKEYREVIANGTQ